MSYVTEDVFKSAMSAFTQHILAAIAANGSGSGSGGSGSGGGSTPDTPVTPTSPLDGWTIGLYDATNFLGFAPDHGSSNGRYMVAVITPATDITFRTITVFSTCSQCTTATSGASSAYGPRIYEVSGLPGTADGGKSDGSLTGLHVADILVNDSMEMLVAESEDGTAAYTTDFGGKYGVPITIADTQFYSYTGRKSDGSSISLSANTPYLFGMWPYTNMGNAGNTSTFGEHEPLLPVLSNYTITGGSESACGWANTNNSSTTPTRFGYYNTVQSGGDSSVPLKLPLILVDNTVYTDFKGYSVVKG